MSTFITKEMQAGIDAARKAKLSQSSRLRVQHGEETWKVLRMWQGGMALDADTTPHLRGLVDIYDGANHVCQALIVASEVEGGEIRCDFKRATPHSDAAPRDFAVDEMAPVALIAKG